MRISEIIDEARFERSKDNYSNMAFKMSSEKKLSKLGHGLYGSVFSHPTQDTTVIKIFANDRGYAEWLKWCLQHQNNKYVPKIIPHEDGSIIKLYKYYKRGKDGRTLNQRIGIVHLEKLNYVNEEGIIEFSREIVEKYMDEHDQRSILSRHLPTQQSYFDRMGGADWEEVMKYSRDIDPDLSQLAEFLHRAEKNWKTGLDLNINNFMRRNDGQMVFIDPIVS